jgi:hypothetical protein
VSPGGRARGWRRALVRPTLALALVIGALGSVAASTAAASGDGAQQADEAARVVIVSLPTVRWADVEEHPLPEILDVAQRSATASMSVRTIGPTTTLGEAYATIGAGNRAPAPPDVAGLAFEPDFQLEWGTAGDAFHRRSAQRVDGASVVHIGVAEVTEAAHRMRYGAEPGTLGQALADEDLRSSVVANADLPEEFHREAALAVMDRAGRVAGGTVSADQLEHDAESPFSVRLDPAESAAVAVDALRDSDLVLVEASDLARLDVGAKWMTPEARRDARSQALRSADELVGHIASALDPQRDLLMLLAPVAPGDAGHEQLTMFALAGPGIQPGLAHSGSTRRDGFVTLPDVAPTVLDYLGVDRPPSVNGALIGSTGAGSVIDDRIEGLIADNEIAVFRDRASGPVTVLFIVLQAVVYSLVMLALTRFERLRPAAWASCLLVLAIPPAALLWGLVRYDAHGLPGFLLMLVVAAVALAALAATLGRWHPLGPPLALIGLSLVVQLGDVVAGGWLQVRTVFGYSPIVAGRFSGFGNLAYAIVASSAVVVATATWAIPRMRGPEAGLVPGRSLSWWPLGLAVGVLAATLVVIGMPSWGSDVGGILASVPAFAVVGLLLAGSRVGWGRMAGIATATVAVLGAFTLLDLSRPEEERTHLGRSVKRAADGDAGTILLRKIDASLSTLTSSTWTVLVPIALAFLVFLAWRPPGLLQDLQRRIPGLRACLVGVLLVCVLGMAVNDSGVAVPAMACSVLLPYVAYLVVRVQRRAAPPRPPAEIVARHAAEPELAKGWSG